MSDNQENTQVGDPWGAKIQAQLNARRPTITVADVLHFCETADVSTENLTIARNALDERMGRNYDSIAAALGLPKRRARPSSNGSTPSPDQPANVEPAGAERFSG